MCLLIKRPNPYNKSGYRYKILEVTWDGNIRSIYMYSRWKHAQLITPDHLDPLTSAGSKAFHGIHVFNKLKDAIHCWDCGNHNDTILYGKDKHHYLLVKVQVKGFLGAGVHDNYADYGDGLTGEIWKAASICQVIRNSKSKSDANFGLKAIDVAHIRIHNKTP